MLGDWIRGRQEDLLELVTGSPTPSRVGALPDEARVAETSSPAPQPEVLRLQNELHLVLEELRAKEDESRREREVFDQDNRKQAHKYEDLQDKCKYLSCDLVEERAERRKETSQLKEKYDGLVVIHNTLVKQYNALLARLKGERAERASEKEHERGERDREGLEIAAAKDEALAARKQQHDTEKYCAKLEQENKSLTATARDLQAGALRSVESARWAPLSYSDVEHQIKSMLADIRQWCGEYAAIPFQEFVDPAYFDSFTASLTRHGCIASREQLLDALIRSKALQKGNKAATQLLAAAASSAILQACLAMPFHALVAPNEAASEPCSLSGEAIDGFYHLLRSSDQCGAEVWRCQLLRLLDNTPIAAHDRPAAVRGIANSFIAEFVPRGNEVEEQMQNKLHPVVSEVAELSRKLWTRKACIVVMNFTALAIHFGQFHQLLYEGDSEYLEAHTLHNAVLEDDHQALDGKEVVMVCSPAVVAFGNAKGEDYDKARVIRKAVVWMG